MLSDELDELARKHGATSYRNRADTQNPAYGFTPAGLLNLLAEVTREIHQQDEALIWLMLAALQYHTEQTRPIARTDDAITAALLRLKGDHIAKKGGQHGTE